MDFSVVTSTGVTLAGDQTVTTVYFPEQQLNLPGDTPSTANVTVININNDDPNDDVTGMLTLSNPVQEGPSGSPMTPGLLGSPFITEITIKNDDPGKFSCQFNNEAALASKF